MAVVLDGTAASIFMVDACGNVWVEGRVVGLRSLNIFPKETIANYS
jgi:hypothetical protein